MDFVGVMSRWAFDAVPGASISTGQVTNTVSEIDPLVRRLDECQLPTLVRPVLVNQLEFEFHHFCSAAGEVP